MPHISGQTQYKLSTPQHLAFTSKGHIFSLHSNENTSLSPHLTNDRVMLHLGGSLSLYGNPHQQSRGQPNSNFQPPPPFPGLLTFTKNQRSILATNCVAESVREVQSHLIDLAQGGLKKFTHNKPKTKTRQDKATTHDACV